jgi:hypothetical protein
MTEINIARALVELKTIEDRIQKAIEKGEFITYKTKVRNFLLPEAMFKTSAAASLQSIDALIERKIKLEEAIAISNATTQVTVAGMTMSVSKAIHYKKVVQYSNKLLDRMKQQKQTVVTESEAHRQRVQQKIESNIQTICGREAKPDQATIQGISESIAKSDPIDVFDPLGIEKVIDDREAFNTEFKDNVDLVLTESNCVTKIKV